MRPSMRGLFIVALLSAAGCGSSGDETSSQNGGDAATPAAPDASPYVVGFGDLSVLSLPPGDAGEVAIIASGKALNSQGSVTVVVRNNTSDPVGNIDVTGTARDGAGALVASGSSQGFQPKVVAPGEIAFGYVYFEVEQAGSTFEYSFDVDADPVGDYFVPLTIAELNQTEDSMVGIVTNTFDFIVDGPLSANAICFTANGSIIDTEDGYADQDDLSAGSSGSFSIDLYDRECPVALVAASGYDER